MTVGLPGDPCRGLRRQLEEARQVIDRQVAEIRLLRELLDAAVSREIDAIALEELRELEGG